MQFSPMLQSMFEPWSLFLAEDPLLRMLQCIMLFGGVIAVFLVFYTTRDILLRSNSFLYMFVSILLVAALPLVGFFLYLLIRPARTLKEKQFQKMVEDYIAGQETKPTAKPKQKTKKPVTKKAKTA